MMFRGPLLFYAFLIFLAVCARVSQLNAELTNAVRRTLPPKNHKDNHKNEVLKNASGHAWGPWGDWSPCSMTCGGGVAVQERQCLPIERMHRTKTKRKTTLEQNRRKRSNKLNRSQDCLGISRRYHECNTAPCIGSAQDTREAQCSKYDQRPFRGRYYAWVPYVDGNSPCTLNCRPRGHHFYATLGLAADGTPCTQPGYRAVCVQGECKVVGKEEVIATNEPLRCGRRLVSGLFTRPRLPLGYSLVATVPRGACRLNVTELSPSENYIALKMMNGSYIMNGEFAVSAPGIYDAAGARFHYSRNALLDSVFTRGPIQTPIDIMILYTQPNPSIKYEYLIDAEQEEANTNRVAIPTSNKQKTLQDAPHQRHHRHHAIDSGTENKVNTIIRHFQSPETSSKKPIEKIVGNRKFVWKILSFTTCSRSCGGGLQIGKFQCVEIHDDHEMEVSAIHCAGPSPPSRRRRCGTAVCKPRWRTGAWSSCPPCGPAQRIRVVGCVQDNSKGITKVNDQECPLPMPPATEECPIPSCSETTIAPKLETRRQIRPRDKIESFRESPVVPVVANASENEVTPAFHPVAIESKNLESAGWLYTDWSECVGFCVGGGVQTRGTRCADPAGCVVRDHVYSQTCKPRIACEAHNGQWFTSEWSKCSASCGGQQIRGVLCIGGTGRRLRDTACKGPRPASTQACGGTCPPNWYLSEWSACNGPCEAGIQTRTVWCTRHGNEGSGGAAKDSECPGLRPQAKRTCVPPRCTNKPVSVKFTSPNESQQRVTRNQSQKPKDLPISERSFTDATINATIIGCGLAALFSLHRVISAKR